MKKKTILLSMLLLSFVISADPTVGYWKSMEGKKVSGYWKFYIEDDTLYGICILSPTETPDVVLTRCKNDYPGHPYNDGKLYERRQIDTPLIFDLKKVREGVWQNGKIIDPRNGKMYICEIFFCPMNVRNNKGELLGVRGEIGMGVGMTLYWERASVSEINAAYKETIDQHGSHYAKKNLDHFLIK